MSTGSTNPSKQASAAKVSPLSLKLTPASRHRLRELAEQQRRPAHALAREAIEAYLDQQEELIRKDREADASWRHYQDTGLHVSGEEALAWIQSWGTPKPLPKPVCHV